MLLRHSGLDCRCGCVDVIYFFMQAMDLTDRNNVYIFFCQIGEWCDDEIYWTWSALMGLYTSLYLCQIVIA